jgi:hypothetical protein
MNFSSVHLTIQPDKSLIQSEWGSAVDNVYTLPHLCKGVELASGATAGLLEVHLVNDSDNKWYLLPLSPTDCKGRVFDKIRTTNTTVELSSVTCFPV